jgi:hypothetical protein
VLLRLVPARADRYAMEHRSFGRARTVTAWAFQLPPEVSEGNFGWTHSQRGIVVTQDGEAFDVARAASESGSGLDLNHGKGWVWRPKDELSKKEVGLMFAEMLKWLGRESEFWTAMRGAGLAP